MTQKEGGQTTVHHICYKQKMTKTKMHILMKQRKNRNSGTRSIKCNINKLFMVGKLGDWQQDA